MKKFKTLFQTNDQVFFKKSPGSRVGNAASGRIVSIESNDGIGYYYMIKPDNEDGLLPVQEIDILEKLDPISKRLFRPSIAE